MTDSPNTEYTKFLKNFDSFLVLTKKMSTNLVDSQNNLIFSTKEQADAGKILRKWITQHAKGFKTKKRAVSTKPRVGKAFALQYVADQFVQFVYNSNLGLGVADFLVATFEDVPLADLTANGADDAVVAEIFSRYGLDGENFGAAQQFYATKGIDINSIEDLKSIANVQNALGDFITNRVTTNNNAASLFNLIDQIKKNAGTMVVHRKQWREFDSVMTTLFAEGTNTRLLVNESDLTPTMYQIVSTKQTEKDKQKNLTKYYNVNFTDPFFQSTSDVDFWAGLDTNKALAKSHGVYSVNDLSAVARLENNKNVFDTQDGHYVYNSKMIMTLTYYFLVPPAFSEIVETEDSLRLAQYAKNRILAQRLSVGTKEYRTKAMADYQKKKVGGVASP